MFANSFRIIALAWAVCSWAAAQKPDTVRSSQPPSQSTATQIQPTSPTAFLKRMVTFLTLDYGEGISSGQVRGTGFFVFYPDKRVSESGGFVYLVTNRHVAEPDANGQKLRIR